MNAIKAEELDLYCLLEGDSFLVTLLLRGQIVSTFEYKIRELAEEFVSAYKAPEGLIEGEDVEDAYILIEALDDASEMINNAIGD